MARWLLLVAVSCSASAQPADQAAPGAATIRHDAAAALTADASAPPDAVALAPPPSHEQPGETKLAALQASLGAEAATCAGTAKLLASQGTTTDAKVRWREQTVLRLCVADRWPDAVRECVATAAHDQLACTAYLTTQRQRARWNAAFEDWIEN